MPNTAGDAIVQFKLNDLTGLATPIENLRNPRGYGFVQGGQTAGGAREFIIQNGTVKEIGAHGLRIIYLGK